jgi:secretion/DNA translocation related TadE-like protein
VLALTSLLVLVGATFLAWAGAVAARSSAASAADLAALAAAAAASGGSAPACSAAAEVAERSGASLEDCRVTGDVVDVVVSVPVRWPADAGPARARSRAGPASSGASEP